MLKVNEYSVQKRVVHCRKSDACSLNRSYGLISMRGWAERWVTEQKTVSAAISIRILEKQATKPEDNSATPSLKGHGLKLCRNGSPKVEGFSP